MFIDRLLERIIELKNPSIIGLDPDVTALPEHLTDGIANSSNPLKSACDAIEVFNKQLIDATCDVIPAIKPQAAYYEMYGVEGMRVLKTTIDYARSKGMLVIADVKRSDIGTTAKAYSNAYLGRTTIGNNKVAVFDVDAVTVNPYLGSDGIKPFIEGCKEYDKGMFILVKTSNPSSGELQDLLIDSNSLYSKVGSLVEEWGKDLVGKYGYSSIGAVVGATYPAQLKELREKMPKTLFLVPGYGAQGGKAEDIKLSYDKNNLGAIVNSSRGLMYAYKSEMYKNKYSAQEFAKATREEAIRMKNDLWG